MRAFGTSPSGTSFIDSALCALAWRLWHFRQELLTCVSQPGVPPDNNAAERAIRPLVVARKISGGSRSKNGAEAWATLASLLRCANQQGKNLLETIKSMLMAAWATDKTPTMPAGP